MADLTTHRNVYTLKHYHSSLTRIGDNIGESYVNHGVFDRLRRLREQAKAEINIFSSVLSGLQI